MKKTISGSGGARPGAGRKDLPTKRRMNFTIDNGIADLLDKEPNKSALVESLLGIYYASKR
ncbi:hypothetical protein [Chitinophaga sp. CF418]|uniref:hypothetical protein n=1 Tax=Chitinophaga sp. CF418 TaxID=1855287 RepID=UPI00122C1D78|nr:hypothetical protein [Chitinophaga sp. CF418]